MSLPPHRYDEVGGCGEEGGLEGGGAALEGGVERPQHEEVQQHDEGDSGRLQRVDYLERRERGEIRQLYRKHILS